MNKQFAKNTIIKNDLNIKWDAVRYLANRQSFKLVTFNYWSKSQLKQF